jgi:hypothetical protein
VLRYVAPTLRPPRPSRLRKAKPAKKAPKGRTKPEVGKPKAARDDSKTAKILDLGDMDWIVRQAFVHNPTLKIDLVLSAGRSRLKSVEAVAGNDVNVLWTA